MIDLITGRCSVHGRLTFDELEHDLCWRCGEAPDDCPPYPLSALWPQMREATAEAMLDGGVCERHESFDAEAERRLSRALSAFGDARLAELRGPSAGQTSEERSVRKAPKGEQRTHLRKPTTV